METPSSFGRLLLNPTSLAENLIVGLFQFVALLFLYRAYVGGVMSIAAPIASSYPVITIILSVVILRIMVPIVTALGISVVVAGIILAGIRLPELRKLTEKDDRSTSQDPTGIDRAKSEKSSRKILFNGVDSAIFACFSFGIVYFGLDVVTKVFGVIIPVFVMRGGAALSGFILLIPLKQKLIIPNRSVLPWLLLLALLDSLGFLAFNEGISSAQGSLPIVVTLSGLFGAVTMVLARAIYREKLDTIQNLGIIILLIGVGIVLYF